MTATIPASAPVSANQPSWQYKLVTRILIAACFVAPVALIPAIFDSIPNGQWLSIALYIIDYAFILAGAILHLPYRIKAGGLLVVLYSLGINAIFENTLRGAAHLYLFSFIMLALVLFSFRASLIALGLSVVSLVSLAALSTLGIFTPLDPDAVVPDLLEIADTTATFVLLALPVLLGLNLFQSEFAQSRVREQEANQELLRERAQLELRVAERTHTAERRSQQVAAGAEIARAASTELNPDALLQKVVDLIRDRLNLYYTGVFIIDENNRYAVLRAGTGEAGQTLVARNHRLEIGGVSMIGRALAERKARIALDVGQEAVRFSNPLLPLTRSEMALPLVARDKIVGALTIQSDQPEAFSPEDVISLQGMADLIAVALDNARLYQEAQQALQEVSSVHRSYLSQAWETFARNRMEDESQPPTYTYSENTFKRGETVSLPELDRAIDEHKPVITIEESASTVTVPIRLRDQVIGAVSIETDSPDRVWDRDELALLEAVLEQTALSLENARLIEETETALADSRRLASRERTVNTISSKIRRLPSVESVLTTALVELGRTLGANKGAVRLGTLARRDILPEAKDE